MPDNLWDLRKQTPDYVAGYRFAHELPAEDWELPSDSSQDFRNGFLLGRQRRHNAFTQGTHRHSDYGWAHPDEEIPADPPEVNREIWDCSRPEYLGLKVWQDFVDGWHAAHASWLRGVWGHRTVPFVARERATKAVCWAVPDEERGGFSLRPCPSGMFSVPAVYHTLPETRFVTWREFDREFDPVGQERNY